MARRLLEQGFAVTVYNRNPEKSAALASAGATVAATPRAAAAKAEVIISMVSDDAASRSLWLGAEGILSAIQPGAICIESSSLSVGWVKELAAAVAAKDAEFLDCPVTGSKAQAPTGELRFLVGGPGGTLEKVRTVLEALSVEIIHLGPTGSGVLLKLVNNSLNGVQIAAFAEALAALERSGIDLPKALGVITNGASGSPIVKAVAPRMTARDYTPNFHLKLLAKDIGYAIGEGHCLTAPMTMAVNALKLFREAAAAGYGEQDMAAIVEPFRK